MSIPAGAHSAPPAHGHRTPPDGGRPAPRGPRAGPPRPTDPGGRPLAEWWERLIARLLDNVILSSVLVVAEILGAVPMALIAWHSHGMTPIGVLIGGASWFAVIGVSYAIATYVYEVVLFGGRRVSIGKRVLKLAVVSAADGARPDRATRRRRWLVMDCPMAIGYILFPLLPVAWAYQLYDALSPLGRPSTRQALHDRYAGTMVIREGR